MSALGQLAGALLTAAPATGWVVSVEPLAFLSNGASAFVERTAGPRFAVGAGLGVRQLSSGDYRGVALGGALELAYWPGLPRSPAWTSPSPSPDPNRGPVHGLSAALRLALGWTTVWTSSGRGLGSLWTPGLELHARYRLYLASAVHLTPSLGVGWSTQVDPGGRLPAASGWHALLGLAVGLAL